MASKTYSGNYATGIVLGANNPIYITGTVTTTSGDGISGISQPYTVVNSGRIETSAYNKSGIYLKDAGSRVTNYGTIEATGGGGVAGGVNLYAGGSVANGGPGATAALISGYAAGVYIEHAAGTVVNDGKITSSAYGAGVALGDGGTVTNGAPGVTAALISGGYEGGVLVKSAAGTVVNDGKITSGAYGAGVYLQAGGRVTNGAPGVTAALISGGSAGVFIEGAAGTVVNDGKIEGTGVGGDGVLLYNGGKITNGAGATTALISGYGAAILIENAAGAVANDGTVEGTGASGYGVKLSDGGSVTNGTSAAPAALISGNANGVYIGTTAGSVVNDGTVEGGTGIWLNDGGKVTNGAPGVTTALVSGYANGVYVKTAAGVVTNDGTVKGAGVSGIGVWLNAGGNVTNGGAGVTTALVSGYSYGVFIPTAAGTVVNHGTVEGTGIGGVAIKLGDGGKLTNGGPGVTAALASGYRFGIEVFGATGAVANDGTVVGVGAFGEGIALVAGGNVSNGAPGVTTAVVAGYSYGIVSNAAATVANDGTVVGRGVGSEGIKLGDGGTVTNGTPLVTTAVIAGYANGIVITGAAATITNHGTVEGTGASGVGVYFVGFYANTLTNVGRIIGIGGTAVSFGGGNDLLIVDAGAVFTGAVSGGAGTNKVEFAAPGTDNVTGFTGFETIVLANGGANILTLTNANFTGVMGSSITVDGGNAGNTVNAAALTGVNRVIVIGGAGVDHFTGGAGNDIFEFAATNLANTDTVMGGGGSDELLMTTAGTINAGGVSGVETFHLAGGGTNSLTLASANFAGVAGSTITVIGGNSGNTVNGSSLPSTDAIAVHAGSGADTLTGGAGNDFFYAGGDTSMTGNAGTNAFVFSAVGNNTIADFTASTTNEIAFSNSGFALGLSGASPTPKPLPATLFVSDSTGTFTATTERFAYGTTNGELFYSASGTTATEHLVAKLTGDPNLTASHLFFVT